MNIIIRPVRKCPDTMKKSVRKSLRMNLFILFSTHQGNSFIRELTDVDQMMSEGLVEEVKRLKEMGCTKEMVSMQGLGYKEILAYLDGEYALTKQYIQSNAIPGISPRDSLPGSGVSGRSHGSKKKNMIMTKKKS